MAAARSLGSFLQAKIISGQRVSKLFILVFNSSETYFFLLLESKAFTVLPLGN